jgi:hypothetical protein
MRYIYSNFSSNGAFVSGQGSKTRRAMPYLQGYPYTIKKITAIARIRLWCKYLQHRSKISLQRCWGQILFARQFKAWRCQYLGLDGASKFTVAFDINKLLVPTPPIRDADGNIIAG